MSMNLPFSVDLNDKVVVVTGAGGVLMSEFAKALAACGAKVALLDINADAVAKVAAEIGENALPVPTNCLDKTALEAAKETVNAKFGAVNFLINGAGGNSPRATTDKEYYEVGDEDRDDIKTFFNLDKSGFDFVFNLNIMGTLLPTQVFVKDMLCQ